MKNVIICIVCIALIAGIGYFLVSPNTEGVIKTSSEYSYSRGNCDTLVHKNVRWAICYKNEMVVETVRHGNLYKVTASVPKDTDDYVEVYNGMDRGLIGTYEGVLYFDIKARCV